MAIIVARLLLAAANRALWEKLKNVPYILGGLIALFVIGFGILFRPTSGWWIVPMVLLSGATLWIIRKRGYDLISDLTYNLAILMVFVGLFLNLIFYPALLSYQSGYKAAKYINDHYQGEYTAVYGIDPHLFHYYLDNELHMKLSIYELLQESNSEMLLLTTGEYVDELKSREVEFKIVKHFDYFNITKLSPGFLIYKKRSSTLEKNYLLQIHKGNAELAGFISPGVDGKYLPLF